MIDKIEVGEYIRTIDGYIRKIDNINTEKRKITVYGEYILDTPYKNSKSVAKKKITKHSHNIIDLIESGDIITYFSNYSGSEIKMEILYVDTKEEDYKWGRGFAVTDLDKPIFKEDIKSIVTKEQFKEMEYKV